MSLRTIVGVLIGLLFSQLSASPSYWPPPILSQLYLVVALLFSTLIAASLSLKILSLYNYGVTDFFIFSLLLTILIYSILNPVSEPGQILVYSICSNILAVSFIDFYSFLVWLSKLEWR